MSDKAQKFKLIKKVQGKVNCYGLGEFATSDIIDVPAHLVAKAKANPSYELVTETLSVKNAK